jgi:exodeoxyribonuclease-1
MSLVGFMEAVAVNRFSFCDTETSGIDTQLDQILQFANIFTDADLNIEEDTISNIICRPRPDIVPHPKAFLTHHLDIDILNAEGVNEFVLARKVQNAFVSSDKIGISGYNTGKFDDEMFRNLFFRNMKGMYDHEWKGGNFRFDVLKLIQLVYALRPELLNWKLKEDGKTSLKLADMAPANGILHENAHDALSDVLATIGLAKKVKESNGRIFDYALGMSMAGNVMNLLNAREPILHISSLYGMDNNITTMIYPLIKDKANIKKYHCVDLRTDPKILLELSPEDIRKYLFTKRADLPEDSPKIPLNSIQINKQPMIVSLSVMNDAISTAANLNIDDCMRNLEVIKRNRQLGAKIQSALIDDMRPASDPYRSIYIGGFLDNEDQRIRAVQHMGVEKEGDDSLNIEVADVHDLALNMKDYVRHFDLLLRCKWNSFYDKQLSTDKFSPTEFRKWTDYLSKKLYQGVDENDYTIPKFRKEMAAIDLEVPLDADDLEILRKLTAHVDSLEDALMGFKELSESLFSESEDERKVNMKIEAIESRISIVKSFETKSSHLSVNSAMTM